MSCCFYMLLMFVQFLTFSLPSWTSEKQIIKVLFKHMASARSREVGRRVTQGIFFFFF